MKLTDLRKNIDKVDAEIVRLVARRQSYMPKVAVEKKKLGLPIFQPARENTVLRSKLALAKRYDVSLKLVQKIFDLLLADSRRIQRKN